MASARLRLGIYLAVSYTLAYAIDFTLALPLLTSKTLTGTLAAIPVLLARMYTPTLGALAGLQLEGAPGGIREKLGRIGLRDPGPRWILAGAGMAVAGLALSLILSPLLGLSVGRCGSLKLVSVPVLILLGVLGFIAGITVNLIAALGEELGWRGYMHVLLVRETGSTLLTGLIVGVAWGLWHAPLIYAGYNYGLGGLAYCGAPSKGLTAVAVFTAFTAMLGVIMALLRERSQSVIPSAAMHGTLNGLSGLVAGLVVGPRILAPPAGLAGIAGYTVLLPLVYVVASRVEGKA
ncbi:MAG: CPBP family intramembrane metalloprotease [Desulfurococcales archaeon]|nr:CPBP family intramembrane metalloprotease [Desulfurococcales archaeon]